MNKKHIYRNILKVLVFGGLSFSGFSAVSLDIVSTSGSAIVTTNTKPSAVKKKLVRKEATTPEQKEKTQKSLEKQNKVDKVQDNKDKANKKTDKNQVVDLPVNNTTADPEEVL